MDWFRRLTSEQLAPTDGPMSAGATFRALSTVRDAPDPTEPDTPEPAAEPAADGGSSAEGDGQARQAAEPADDGDELDAVLADDDDLENAPEHERFSRLRKSHNRLKRKLGKAAPTLRVLREAGVKDIAELLQKARQFDQLAQVAEKNPRFRAVLFGEEPQGEPHARTPEPPVSDDFDPKTLPFDVSADDPLNQFLVGLARDLHGVRKENAELKRLVFTDHTSRRQQAEAAEKQQWSTALASAKAELPEHLHAVFHDAMVSAYTLRRDHKKTPQQVIDHYLAKFRASNQISKKTEQIASGAARERAATTTTKKWPAPMAGGGAPAPASRHTPTLRDLNKRIRSGAYAGAGAR